MKKYVLLILTLCMHCIARGQTAHYWFDTQSGEERLQTAVMAGQFDVDVSELKGGLHTLHYQATDIDGRPSPTISSIFVKPYSKDSDDPETFRCWFDEDYQNSVTGSFSDGVFFLNTENLTNGAHTVHLYAEGTCPSPTVSATYIKYVTPESFRVEYLRCVCYVDGTAVEEQVLPATGGLINWNVDVAHLKYGVHTQRITIYNQNGVALTERSSIFIHMPQNKNLTKYDYWLNDEGVLKTVELEGQPSEYNLLTMLPVENRPIRSECFHFAVEDGVPKVYAKNDIHIRFHDNRGDLTDVSGQYVDEHISQSVDATLLGSDVSQTIDKPANNEIKWFMVEAVRGDSLTFKLDRAATLQLFSPSGEEVYSASGAESVKWDGCHAAEDGTFFLALHDVTAQQGSNLTLEYQHIDKYAVLSYTPDTIGVATCFMEMRLDGNGYDKLEKVQLVLDENIIEPDSVNVVSKSSAIIRFPIFGDEQLGDYDIKLDFVENDSTEQLTIVKGVTLSPISMGNIEIRVNPSKTIGYPYPVTISVTNNGNMSMLYVPFNIATTFDLSEWRANASVGESAWASMWPMNFNLFEYNGSIGYSPYTTSYSLFGTGLPGMVLHGFIPLIGPHETRDYIVGFVGSGHAKFMLYAWTGRPMNATYEDEEGETNIYSVWKYLEKLNEVDSPQNSRVHRAPPNYEGMNNVLNVADHINSNAAQAARTAAGIGLAGGGLINGLRLRQIHQYDDDDFASEVLSDYRESLEQNMPDPGTIASTAGIPDWMAALMGLQQCQAGCGTPMPKGHVIEILAPGDPNDISGYTSDSGSRYLKEGTTDVCYSIEFENDPELANASAHTITVTDTLDAAHFDLTSFEPTSVKIGRKTMTLNGETSFSNKTLDLRPESEVVAQVSLKYDEQKGIAKWTIESLDPMTMEPIADAYRGVLPVNTDGNGMGELTFDIKLKPGLQDGDEVSNRASIVFDQEAAIMTPIWTNIVDGVNPISRVTNVAQTTDSTAVVQITASDERSKPWQYDLYRQNGVGAPWQREAVGVPADSSVVIAIESGVNYGFYVVMTDSAGNVEQKQAVREFTLNLSGVTPGDVNSDGVTDTQDAIKVTQFYLKKNPTDFLEEASDVNGDGTTDTQDAIKIIKIYLKKE